MYSKSIQGEQSGTKIIAEMMKSGIYFKRFANEKKKR